MTKREIPQDGDPGLEQYRDALRPLAVGYRSNSVPREVSQGTELVLDDLKFAIGFVYDEGSIRMILAGLARSILTERFGEWEEPR